MIKVKLARIKDSVPLGGTELKPEGVRMALRTQEVLGLTHDLPEEGERFGMIAAPLTPGADGRLVSTSPVVKVEREGKIYTFTTKSGTVYQVEDMGVFTENDPLP